MISSISVNDAGNYKGAQLPSLVVLTGILPNFIKMSCYLDLCLFMIQLLVTKTETFIKPNENSIGSTGKATLQTLH